MPSHLPDGLAVQLDRPAEHEGSIETVNDADRYICNFWRALAHDPEQVAHYADYPVNECDLFSRHLWLVNEGQARMATHLEDDPDWYDAKIAGWWVWGISAWIGGGWCSGQGAHRQLPHLGNGGKGVHRTSTPDLYVYMDALAARLRRVRVCCGDWSRIVTKGALSASSTVGIFLDPPYSAEAGRNNNLYTTENPTVAHEVREWAIANGDNPRYRIVLCGYETEHGALMPASWRKLSYSANSSYQNSSGKGRNQENRHEERLWFSPHCLNPNPTLFEVEE